MNPILVAALAGASLAARPPAYGGDVVVYAYGAGIDPDPAEIRTAAAASAHAAVFERLYDATPGGLVPVLAAGLPTVDGPTVTVPLRPGVVAHDGRPVTPERVIEALERVGRSTAGAYVMHSVRRQGRRFAIAEEAAIRFELARPDPDFPHLLAADHARLAWTTADGRRVGTGPFRWVSASEQRPFLEHREGRPFVDRIIWRPYASRFGARSLAQQGRSPIFGGPEGTRTASGPGTWLVLQVGPGVGGARDRLRAHLQAALRRPRIVRRYLGPDDKPDRAFISSPAGEPSVRVNGDRPLRLLAVRGLRFGHRLVERVQLDLFNSGVRAQIEWVDATGPWPAVGAEAGDFDLRLFEVRPGIIDDGSERAALHRVLSAAAALGALSVVKPEPLAAFAEGDTGARKRALATIELAVRRASGAVVIGRTVPAVALPATWTPAARDFVDWADLQVAAP